MAIPWGNQAVDTRNPRNCHSNSGGGWSFPTTLDRWGKGFETPAVHHCTRFRWKMRLSSALNIKYPDVVPKNEKATTETEPTEFERFEELTRKLLATPKRKPQPVKAKTA